MKKSPFFFVMFMIIGLQVGFSPNSEEEKKKSLTRFLSMRKL
ncbi:hypothetical protein [Bacillus toyonensis]|nr:hypothetical protein [Bacillus toyonensis]